VVTTSEAAPAVTHPYPVATPEATSLGDEPGRQGWRATRLGSDEAGERRGWRVTRLEGDEPARRRACTSTSLHVDKPARRQAWAVTGLDVDEPGRGRAWTGTGDEPGRRRAWTRTSPDVDEPGRGRAWTGMSLERSAHLHVASILFVSQGQSCLTIGENILNPRTDQTRTLTTQSVAERSPGTRADVFPASHDRVMIVRKKEMSQSCSPFNFFFF
jgi:hypothetical protein